MKGKPKKFRKEKKELYTRWDESELSDFKNEEKGEEANLSLTNANICFMANENEVNFDDYYTLKEIKDAYVELVSDFKNLSKKNLHL